MNRQFCAMCRFGVPVRETGAMSDEQRATLNSGGATVVAIGFGAFVAGVLGGTKGWALAGAVAGYGVVSLARVNAELAASRA